MARPLRLELSGGLYHVTSRGDGQEDIYLSDADRITWLDVFGQVCQRFNWVCHAWCQMTNHDHLLIETPEANLTQGMRQLNGVYTQRFNRRHGRVGHVFQGRYKAILVERDSYLLELARYVILNPLRANRVKRLEAWPWSSYRSTCGQAGSPAWLQTDWILAQFGPRRSSAIAKYIRFVHEGARLPSVWTQLQGQIYLGSDAFVRKMQTKIKQQPSLDEIPRAQRRAITQPLAKFQQCYPRHEAMARAYLSGQHSMAAIARHFGVHYSTVSRAVRQHEQHEETNKN
ncbi:MAG: addiction module toxin RelE [Gammaproteobacteria bacterium]|nr:MAG: addiction module toxin RelE [Gammaproteobacteria bacterium]